MKGWNQTTTPPSTIEKTENVRLYYTSPFALKKQQPHNRYSAGLKSKFTYHNNSIRGIRVIFDKTKNDFTSVV